MSFNAQDIEKNRHTLAHLRQDKVPVRQLCEICRDQDTDRYMLIGGINIPVCEECYNVSRAMEATHKYTTKY